MGLAPTAEQLAILQAHATGDNLVINAGAGTEKTTTVRLLAEADPSRQGLYVAFNASVAKEAQQSFPANTVCLTMHGMAYREMGIHASPFRTRLNGPRVPGFEAAKILNIQRIIDLSAGKSLKPNQQAQIVTNAVRRFCYSADTEPRASHIWVPEVTDAELNKIREALYPKLLTAWRDVQSPHGRLKFEHDHYLKMWALTGPVLPVDQVFFDEAQDANPVVVGILKQQQAQMIVVGDRNQAIYGWRGARDAMNAFGGVTLNLSQSWRFGPNVAQEANKWLASLGAELRLTGAPHLDTQVYDEDNYPGANAILCRTNSGCIGAVMDALEANRKVALTGNTAREISSMARAAMNLQKGKRVEHPAFMAFESWSAVEDYVKHNADEATDIAMFVRLVKDHGAWEILRLMDQLTDPMLADVTVSTVHKAKGLEWPVVQIGDDFKSPQGDDGDSTVDPAERMLSYVAVTRAQKALHRGSLDWIDSH